MNAFVLKALDISKIRYRRLFEAAPDGILLLNAETARIEHVNPHLVEMLGYSRAELLGKELSEVGWFAGIVQSKEMLMGLKTNGNFQYDDVLLKTKAGVEIAVEVVGTTYDCDGIKVIQCNIRNITARHEDRAKIHRHTQLYAALNRCYKAIVHSSSQEELFRQVCRLAVQFGGIKMAWIGLIDADTRRVHPVASSGDDTEYLKDMIMSADIDSPFGRSPTGTAIREGQPFWCQDFLGDPINAPLREPAVCADFAASAALPLYREGVVVGILTLHSGELNAFDETARDLLVEMAADIGFALDNFVRESQRRQIEEQMQFKNTILETQQETSLDASLVVDEHGKIVSYNQKFIDLWRLSPQLVGARLDAPVLKSVAEQAEEPEEFFARVQFLNKHREERSHEEIRLKDGRIIDRYSAPVMGADRKHYGRVWYFRDVTERKRSERLVRDSEKRFSAIFDQVPVAMALLDRYGHPVISNSNLSEMLGYSNGELSKMKFADFTYPEDVDKDLDKFTELLEGKIPAYNMEKRYVHKKGHLIWVNLFVTVLRDENGLTQDVIGMAEDITERKTAETRIKFLNRVYAVLSGINALIVRALNRDELFREACRIVTETGGFRMALIAIVDRSTMKIVPVASAGTDEDLQAAIKGILSSDVHAENTLVARAIREKKAVISNDSENDPAVLFGKEYAESGVRSLVVLPLLVAGAAVGVITLYASEIEFFHEEEMQLLTELAGDIAFAIDHIEKQERLNYLAYYDPLTGLANRSLFLDRVAQHMRSAISGEHKLAVGLVDLERFNNINASLGRTAGDELLRQVAEWLARRAGDSSLVARIDTDHFAFLIPKIKKDDNLALFVDDNITAFLQHPYHLNDAVFRIGAKFSIALFPDDGEDADTLLKGAEAALKKAKTSGERCLFYTRKMTESVANNLTLENRLRQAIGNEEFVLHYQPKVNFVSGKVTSAEALIRWNDPRTGLVPPGLFIPILEETGLIYEVGRWALRKAVADYLRWRAAGLSAVRIAVNVSSLQLRNPGFIDEIRQIISVDPQAAAGLELEITESMIMEDVRHGIDILQAIRDLGVSIAIDDFGTGFSSLNYLSKLPLDALKIDGSFVTDMTNGPKGLALVSTIIQLAHALKLKVVAEAVETDEQARLLRLLDCDEMQGYLFSKPVPAEIFETRFLVPPLPGDER